MISLLRNLKHLILLFRIMGQCFDRSFCKKIIETADSGEQIIAKKEYLYCSRDLQQEPEKYHYSVAGDSSYIRSFLDLRSKKIQEIEKMIGTAGDIALFEQKYPMFLNLCVVEKKLGKWLDFLPAFKKMTLKEFPPHCQRFETCDIISHCIKDLLNGDFYKAKKRLNILIKKFEVFRRIQSAYDDNYRKLEMTFMTKAYTLTSV